MKHTKGDLFHIPLCLQSETLVRVSNRVFIAIVCDDITENDLPFAYNVTTNKVRR